LRKRDVCGNRGKCRDQNARKEKKKVQNGGLTRGERRQECKYTEPGQGSHMHLPD